MILREYDVGKFARVDVSNEADFLDVNEAYGFISVDSLPDSLGGRYLKLDGSFVVNSVFEETFVLLENERLNKLVLLSEIDYAKAFLLSTDHKTFSDYELKVGEDLSTIFAQRSTARKLIRDNQTL